MRVETLPPESAPKDPASIAPPLPDAGSVPLQQCAWLFKCDRPVFTRGLCEYHCDKTQDIADNWNDAA